MSRTKYDWKGVPKEVQWMATNEWGYAHHYSTEPRKMRSLGIGFWNGREVDLPMLFPYQNPYKGDWEDSLEERPK